MKLIIAIVSNDDSSTVMKELIKQKYFVTKLASTGGFLKSGNTTLMIGAKDEDVVKIEELIGTFSKTRKEFIPSSVGGDFAYMTSSPIEVTVGGATIFVIDVEKFSKV